MKKPPEREWPAIASDYTDEYGQIQVEVYMAAGAIWDAARRFALITLQGSHTGSKLLFRAAVIVSLKRTEPNVQIEDLKAYLFQTYKHLVLDELRKENRRKEIQAERRAELDSLSISITCPEDIDRKILLEQIVRRMDPWLRRVEEAAPTFSSKSPGSGKRGARAQQGACPGFTRNPKESPQCGGEVCHGITVRRLCHPHRHLSL